MSKHFTRLSTAFALIFGLAASSHAAVAIYEITGPNDSVKYAARAATRAEAEQTARRSQLGSLDQLKILGGCDRVGWYGHVIFFPSFGKESSFAACGFDSRQALLEKLKSQLAAYGSFLAVKNVISRYDDGKPGEGDNPRAALSRFKGFGCLAYSEYNPATRTERRWLEYQPSGQFGERSGRYTLAPDGSSLEAVTQCQPKNAPEDTIPRELLPL
jgi:hypothetical protein